MYTVYSGYLPTLPEEWYHDPVISDKNGWTVAIHMASKGNIGVLPCRWEHDPNIMNHRGWTVAMYII